MSDRVNVWTDGACSGNPGVAGWAFLVEDGVQRSGFILEGTNNIAELKAVIHALVYLGQFDVEKICVHTDSMYVINGITKWVHGWVKNGWTTSNKKPVKNLLEWARLYELVQDIDVTWVHVKGHSGIEQNEIVDKLAVKEYKAYQTLTSLLQE